MADQATRLHAQQRALTRYLRDPLHQPAPGGWDDQRLGVYRTLVFNTVEALLAGGFPVIRAVLGDAGWRDMVGDFLREHDCRTPLFPQVGTELIAWLDSSASLPRPFLRELAHYEWVELALQIAGAGPNEFDAIAPDADVVATLLAGQPVVSAVAWPLAYAWPVQRISAGFQPQTPPDAPTLLLVRRDAAGSVHFSELTPFAYRLLERLAAHPGLSGRQQLAALALEAGLQDESAVIAAATPLLLQLHAINVIPGTARKAPLTGFGVDPGALRCGTDA